MAGFLDGDGSIYVRLKPNKTYRYRFQIALNIVFFQSNRGKRVLKKIQEDLKIGYIRQRNDGITEYIIGDEESIKLFLNQIISFLKFKKKQALLMLEILTAKEKIKNSNNFLSVAKKIDKFEKLNYSKRRTQTSLTVKKVLKNEGLLTP